MFCDWYLDVIMNGYNRSFEVGIISVTNVSILCSFLLMQWEIHWNDLDKRLWTNGPQHRIEICVLRLGRDFRQRLGLVTSHL